MNQLQTSRLKKISGIKNNENQLIRTTCANEEQEPLKYKIPKMAQFLSSQIPAIKWRTKTKREQATWLSEGNEWWRISAKEFPTVHNSVDQQNYKEKTTTSSELQTRGNNNDTSPLIMLNIIKITKKLPY